jgi:hypothetical protein
MRRLYGELHLPIYWMETDSSELEYFPNEWIKRKEKVGKQEVPLPKICAQEEAEILKVIQEILKVIKSNPRFIPLIPATGEMELGGSWFEVVHLCDSQLHKKV